MLRIPIPTIKTVIWRERGHKDPYRIAVEVPV